MLEDVINSQRLQGLKKPLFPPDQHSFFPAGPCKCLMISIKICTPAARNSEKNK